MTNIKELSLGAKMHLLMKPVGLEAFLAPLSSNPKGLEDCFIEVDSPLSCYRAGETIKGHFKIILKEILKVKSITVSLHGKAKTSWHVWETRTQRYSREQNNPQLRREPYPFEAEQIYIEEELKLCDETSLAPGTHRRSFEFNLPLDIPPSFEGTVGNIRYYIKAKIVRTWKLDHNVKHYLSVVPYMDLSASEKAKKGLVKDLFRELGFLCFKYGAININLKLIKAGFVAGEMIPINISLINQSSKIISKVDLKLLETVQYMAERKGIQISGNRSNEKDKKVESRVIVSLSEDVNVLPHSEHTFTKSLPIPPIAPSFNICNCIQVNYYVKVKLSSSNKFLNSIAVDIPILIGTEPIRNGNEQFYNCNKKCMLRRKEDEEDGNKDLPYTYKESFFGKARFEDLDDKDYYPKCLFYER
uniref:Arrestin_C domain-containing protein n=1 Tax=Parastrongyloides trichosuri TaxID=131310 RepID=A0A0N5A1T5_PARTI